MEYQLIPGNDPRLRAMSREVEPDEIEDLKPLIDAMQRIMDANRGLGISAPQVGSNLRVFLIGGSSPIVVINPKIAMALDETTTETEGCLSFPELFVPVSRPTWINATWLDENGIMQQHQLEGMMARVFLHELDHLNGILYTDRVSKLMLGMARRRMIKHQKKATR